ncbi:Alpha/Beta hydrolase protein [Aspergillus coremiiformis]|uniref:Alpha/Beta hydrolase protein n=1 Tax=Aspergillus coremiiformis TaxID=138285 RepID=A0A5N6YSS6_9EURO|nr:Alpha/Beta hydrolase protein [Aspergillus coremiiformis]
MPKKTPTQSDFPPNLTLTITPPQPPPPPTRPAPNILLLLHGLGDTSASFTTFGRALNLPETTILTLQAPTRLPLDLPGFHWGDDIAFDSQTGSLDMDAGFARATRMLVEVVRGVLVGKCGYALQEIVVLGFGQGGMLGVVLGRELALGGVVSIGAPYPLSGGVVGVKSRTPVLLVAGRDSGVVGDGAVRRTEGVFEVVEVARYARRGDGMPRSREEMLPVMGFLARRLRSWRGVPEGFVEVS